MRYADVASLEQSDVGIIDEDAVGGDEAAGEQADGVQIFDWRFVELLADVANFIGHFRDVHQDGQFSLSASC